MRLRCYSKPNLESVPCAERAVGDLDSALESEERHNPGGWPLSSAFRYRALRLRKDGTLRLCDWCLTNKRRCQDSRRSGFNPKCWKAYRRHQWAVE
jgi:hypothetical protein